MACKQYAVAGDVLRAACLVALLAAVFPGGALASQLIDRNASDVHLAVDRTGRALVTYRADGGLKHVLVWGAVDARQPSPGVPQVAFRVDYAGGWGAFHSLVWKGFRNVCRPYTGPVVPLLVAACTAPDGSHWALQSWQRGLPDLGFEPWTPVQSARELRISHWSGPVAELDVHADWVYGGRFQQLIGQLTYGGVPVHGFGTTSTGVPLDGYGRNLYLDTFDSAYGAGWRRENGFVAHAPNGDFCYGFYPFRIDAYDHPRTIAATGLRGPGTGSEYRITVIGPGVTPDVVWEGPGLHPFDPRNAADVQIEQEGNAFLDRLAASERGCKQH
jgi:hypothetical protein